MSVPLHTVHSHVCYWIGVAMCFEANVCKCMYMLAYFKMEIIDVIV